jgi:hypothetical protein
MAFYKGVVTMKTWRFVSGILSIIFSVLVLLQGCTVGCLQAMAESENISGAAGILVALLMLTGGIESIISHEIPSSGNGTALLIIFGIASLIGFTNANTYKDLYIWSTWCVVCAVLALISICLASKTVTSRPDSPLDNDEFKMRVVDDSMMPTIESGSIVLVHKQNMVCMGEIAVVLIENNSEAVIRKVNYGPNWIELQPTNLNYPTQRFEGENIDKIKIIGLVKEVSKPI